MKRKSKHLQRYLVEDTNIDLYLARVQRGSDAVIRSTFYKDVDPATVLSNWAKRLNVIGSEWPSLLEFEDDLRKKVGPLSVMKPLDKRIPDIESYYDSIKVRGIKPLLPAAIQACLEEWNANHAWRAIKRKAQGATALDMRLSTNSGTPYFTRRRDVLNRTIPVVVERRGSTTTLFGPDYCKEAAAIIGWRGQEGGPNPEDVKQRVVWMFPFGVNVLEMTLYQPLLQWFQDGRFVPAWISNDFVDSEITQMFDTKDPDDLVVCTDFTKFDQHFNSVMQSAARSLISGMVDTDDPEIAKWLRDVFPIKYDIPLIVSDTSVWYGPHGMGSGSGGTNFDETLAHRALQHEAALLSGEELNLHSQCLGDDGIITFPGITVDKVVRAYTEHGQDMNPDKQYAATDHCVYLRRWHHQDYRIDNVCVGVYSTYRALGRLMFQERYYDPDDWGPKMVALRQLSVLENVKYHPLREEFAEFCMRGDKYRLGIDIPGFLTNIQREAEEAIDHMPDFLGYNRAHMDEDTSINNWWIVNFLRSKA